MVELEDMDTLKLPGNLKLKINYSNKTKTAKAVFVLGRYF